MSKVNQVAIYLCVKSANDAVAFYQEVFGAEESFRMTEPNGRIGHLEMHLGPHTLMLSEEFPEMNVLAQPPGTSPASTIYLNVDDCDAVCAAAKQAGATLANDPEDQFYGERSCRMTDPFGYVWMVGQTMEELSPEEMQRRYEDLFSTEGL